MLALIKNSFMNNKAIKVTSLIIGYSLWSFLGNLYTIKIWKKVPVCLYNVAEDICIEAPEIINVCISGKRDDLACCSDMALHLDACSLTIGKHIICPDEMKLFLPNSVKLVHCKPCTISVVVSKKV